MPLSKNKITITNEDKIYYFLLLLIGYISVYDNYLSIKNREVLHIYEQNPIGLFLIWLDCGDIALFTTVKFFGTITALFTMLCFYHLKPIWGKASIIILSIFQMMLLIYLCNN